MVKGAQDTFSQGYPKVLDSVPPEDPKHEEGLVQHPVTFFYDKDGNFFVALCTSNYRNFIPAGARDTLVLPPMPGMRLRHSKNCGASVGSLDEYSAKGLEYLDHLAAQPHFLMSTYFYVNYAAFMRGWAEANNMTYAEAKAKSSFLAMQGDTAHQRLGAMFFTAYEYAPKPLRDMFLSAERDGSKLNITLEIGTRLLNAVAPAVAPTTYLNSNLVDSVSPGTGDDGGFGTDIPNPDNPDWV